ncbi:MAG: hypothetical protein EBX41_10595 [Chitinophagia bacterium]|nr:hypothetical protein [Chitinophagia bacterium]
MDKYENLALVLSFIALFSETICAGDTGPIVHKNASWFVTGGIGYTWYSDGYNGDYSANSGSQAAIGDGQTTIGRFAIGRELFQIKSLPIGLEIGVQNGNTMRANLSQTALNDIGGILPQINIKTLLDFLATTDLHANVMPSCFVPVKLGIAYRRMQINDRTTFNDLSQVAFEVQAGLGYTISEHASVFVTYQGIFDGSTVYTINSNTSTGNISNIPEQNGLLLNVKWNIPIA